MVSQNQPGSGYSPTTAEGNGSNSGRSKAALGQYLENWRIQALTTALVAVFVYLLSIAPDLTWANFGGDGGELITASFSLGVPHPPGYPLYILAGKVFSVLPVGTVAFRYNLLSAVAAAVSAGFATATASNLLDGEGRGGSVSPAVPISVGLVYAFIPLVWGQALITEVYAMNMALVSALLWLMTRVWRGSSNPVISGSIFGLALASHLTSLFLLPLCLYLVQRRQWPKFLAGTAIGLLPLLLLPLLGASASPVIWGRPDTVEGWLWLVTARIYRPNVMSLPLRELFLRLQDWFTMHLWQPVVLGIPLIMIGLQRSSAKERKLQLAFISTALIYTIYSFGYRSGDAVVFILPGLILFSLSLTFGMNRLGTLSLLLPLFLLALNFRGQNLRNDLAVRASAESQMQNLPQGALVLTPGDQTETTLLYFHQVEKTRPDLIIVDDTMFQFDWYRERLSARFPSLVHLELDDVPGFIEANSSSRPICQVGLVNSISPVCIDLSGVNASNNPS